MQRILQHFMEKNNAWNIRSLVDESFVPSAHRTSVLCCRLRDFQTHTANIFNVIFTLFMCVPLYTVIPLHFITAPSTVEKCKHWFTLVYCNIHFVMCLANTCNIYTFSRVSQCPLYIFSVQWKVVFVLMEIFAVWLTSL